MIELEKAVLLIVLSLSGWSILALLLDKRGQRAINYCLALILASLCIPQAYFYSRLLVPPDGLMTLALMSQGAIWLKGPFLWVMVRLVMGRQPSAMMLHFVPFVVATALLIVRPDQLLIVGQLGLLHALLYSLVSLWLLMDGRRRLALIYREYPNTSYFWLLWVIGGLALTMLADFVLMGFIFIHQVLLLDAIRVVSGLISVYLLSIAFFSVYRPPVFFNQDWQPQLDNPSGNQPNPTLLADEKNWRELDESLAQQLAQKLEQLMLKEFLYRQGELSLAQLAARLGVSVHQASELLNVHLGVSFYDHLNRYRLDYAASLLRDPKCEWRILDIAFESGFSNKNSFYRCFRAAFGQTPLEYRNRHLAKTMDEVLQ
ncbi:MAG TPA: helix-turn-helix domain-containing protein [Cellvibrio sp.]|nr:helix-turn-helix domain-containing protein [Cellvibrio sp.]